MKEGMKIRKEKIKRKERKARSKRGWKDERTTK